MAKKAPRPQQRKQQTRSTAYQQPTDDDTPKSVPTKNKPKHRSWRQLLNE